MKTIFVVAALAGLALGGNALAQVDQGKELYQKKMCAACHGAGKKGGDLSTCKHDKAGLVKFLKDPKSVNPKSTMPAFKGTDEEAAAIADYVLTLKK